MFPNPCAQIITLYVSGVVNTVLSPEHQKEMLRYIYNHQARLFCIFFRWQTLQFCAGRKQNPFLFANTVVEWRWRLGDAHWGPQHNAWFILELCCFEIAWRGSKWWRWSHREMSKLDFRSWRRHIYGIMGEVLALGRGLMLLCLWNLWNIKLIQTGFTDRSFLRIAFIWHGYFRYLGYMIGPVITRCHQNYGYCHITCHFTQVLFSFLRHCIRACTYVGYVWV